MQCDAIRLQYQKSLQFRVKEALLQSDITIQLYVNNVCWKTYTTCLTNEYIMQLLWTIEPGLHSIGKKINLRWAHNRRNTDEESTRTHNRNSAVKKTACTADKKWELPLKAPTPLHRFWSFFVPNQPSFPYPPPTPPPEGIDQTIWFHPHNWPFSLYLACRCDPSSDMQKPEERKGSKSFKMLHQEKGKKCLELTKGSKYYFLSVKKNCF